MAVTYEPIASQTLSSSAASVTFGSGGTIPQTYTDLVLAVQCDGVANFGTLRMQFNGDTGTNYSHTRLLGYFAGAISQRSTSQTGIGWASWATGSVNASVTHIMSYSNTNVNKTALTASGNTSDYVLRWVGLWRSTSAITSITLFPEGSNSFTSGSTFSLFGIKAA